MLSPEAKLNLLQISAKYLINNTPNCFVPDAAVVSAELGNSSAEKSLFLHHLGGARLVHQFCAGRPILRKIQRAQNRRTLHEPVGYRGMALTCLLCCTYVGDL